VILIAAVLGTVAGVALSLHRQHVEELELEALAAQAKDDAAPGEAVWVDPPGKPLQSGAVHLTAVEGLPQYPNAFARPLTSAPHDGGVELDIAWFSTKDPIDDVLFFYAREFDRAHKIPVVHRFSPYAGYAAYLDLDTRRLHMISVLAQPHETLVFASSSYPAHMLERGAGLIPAGVPVVGGGEGSLTFDLSVGFGKKQKLWTSTYKQRSIADVRDAYKKALVDAGWTVQDLKAANPQEARLDAKRGAGELEVMIRRDAASNVAVYVSMSGA
jgi:hypothetical protein